MILLQEPPKNVILLKVPKGDGGFLAFGTPSRQIPTLSGGGEGSIYKCITGTSIPYCIIN